MSIGTDEADGIGRRRAALLADLHDLIDAFAVMDEAGLPETVTIQLPVPDGLGHEGKHAWLERVARAWRVEILPDGMGGQYAEKRFGAVRLVASAACPARGVFDYKARAAAHALRSSIASNGLGATA
jgi:predicted nucleotidyltransferase